ncbi:tyrosine-type recombinase/integrase [Microlunatus speluncae]|uniref:tyrosine-type recombinase/integrase n=1 Tax=Microlunatus speluncae TaxID=2594267 RepID=UPI0012663DB5|nr:site-specific integrase [Microlunatus speluncae]
MASIEPRTRVNSQGKTVTRYLVRWRGPDGSEHAPGFDRLRDAKIFKANVEADLVRGEYIDPEAGKITFKAYALRWLEAQTFEPLTAEQVKDRLTLHVFPVLGHRELRQIKPSTIQTWIRGLGPVLAETYKGMIFTNVSTVFNAAVDDELIKKNPCKAPSVSRPRGKYPKIIPWSCERVHAVRSELPERYRIVATLGAGLGLRQGEIFGLSPADVDFLRGKVEVRRQVKLFRNNRQVFALPKGGKTRTVPLPDSVRDDLAAYLAMFGARSVTLPWREPSGEPVTAELVVTNRESKAMNRNYFNPYIWHKALAAAEVEVTRANGCHALRHFYASTLLDAGETIKALSEYLGHADPGFTLRTYTHLMPSSHDRTRNAIDAVLRVKDVYTDGVEAPKSLVKGP